MRTVKGFAKAIKTTTFVVLLQNDLSHFERLLSIFFRCWVFETSKRYRLILQGCETISRVFVPFLKVCFNYDTRASISLFLDSNDDVSKQVLETIALHSKTILRAAEVTQRATSGRAKHNQYLFR